MGGIEKLRRAVERELATGRTKAQVVRTLVAQDFRQEIAEPFVDDVQRDMLDFGAARSMTGIARRFFRVFLNNR